MQSLCACLVLWKKLTVPAPMQFNWACFQQNLTEHASSAILPCLSMQFPCVWLYCNLTVQALYVISQCQKHAQFSVEYMLQIQFQWACFLSNLPVSTIYAISLCLLPTQSHYAYFLFLLCLDPMQSHCAWTLCNLTVPGPYAISLCLDPMQYHNACSLYCTIFYVSEYFTVHDMLLLFQDESNSVSLFILKSFCASSTHSPSE